MKKTVCAAVLLLLFTYLYAQNIGAYDDGYIASIKNNKCLKVKSYPGKNVKPSVLLKNPLCGISSYDDNINSLIILCKDTSGDKTTVYSFSLSMDVCRDSLEIAKKRGY